MAKNNYVSPTLTGYNANPPSDDGSTTEANRVKWDTVKVKIGDPLNTFSSAIDNAIDSALDFLPNNSTTSQSTNFNVATTDDGKIFRVTGNSTASLPSAATAGAGFQVTIKKDEAGNTVTIDPDGSDTIDGQTTNTITEPFEGRTLVSDGSSNWTLASDARRDVPLPTDFINGLLLTNNGTDSDHDVDIGAGSCRDSDDEGNIVNTATIVKEIDATFVEGTNQGGLDTGTVAADTLYYVWAIAKADDETFDALFSLSPTAPTMPSGFDLMRRIGRLFTDSSANIINNQFGQLTLYGEKYVSSPLDTSVSATEHDFFAIPDTADHIVISINGVSSNGTSDYIIQLGDSGGFETTGYDGSCFHIVGTPSGVNFSDGFNFTVVTSAARNYRGHIVLTKPDTAAETWVVSINIAGDQDSVKTGAGDKTLTGTLDRIRLTTQNGTDTFDAGEINVHVRTPALT